MLELWIFSVASSGGSAADDSEDDADNVGDDGGDDDNGADDNGGDDGRGVGTDDARQTNIALFLPDCPPAFPPLRPQINSKQE